MCVFLSFSLFLANYHIKVREPLLDNDSHTHTHIKSGQLDLVVVVHVEIVVV